MSPHVSFPRRRLPTGKIVASGASIRKYSVSRVAIASARPTRCRPTRDRCSARDRSSNCSFLAPMPFSCLRRPSDAAASSSSSVSIPSSAYSRPTVFGPTPWRRSISRMEAGNSCRNASK